MSLLPYGMQQEQLSDYDSLPIKPATRFSQWLANFLDIMGYKTAQGITHNTNTFTFNNTQPSEHHYDQERGEPLQVVIFAPPSAYINN